VEGPQNLKYLYHRHHFGLDIVQKLAILEDLARCMSFFENTFRQPALPVKAREVNTDYKDPTLPTYTL